MANITEPVTIQKPASPTDGTGIGGPAQRIIRDTTGQAGGQHGFVNCASYTYTKAGKDVKQFEWNALHVLDNYADAGENCAGYFQGNAKGKGATFGLVSEVCSTDPNSTAPLTGFESDAWASGAIYDGSGARIANDVVFGDGQFIRKITISPTPAEVHWGQRIAPSGDTPWARAVGGQLIAGFKEVGQMLQAPDEGAIRGYYPQGKYKVLFDSTATDCDTAIRLKAGHRIALDEYDQITIQRINQRVILANNKTPIFEIDINSGDIYKRGVKVI